MTEPDRHTPETEDLQPDPQLKLSSGRANWLQMTLVAAACAVILGIMIYGLNQPEREGNIVASGPGSAETTGAAPQSEQAQTGGNIAGSENADKSAIPAASRSSEPPQQPAPEQAKPATPDDSSR